MLKHLTLAMVSLAALANAVAAETFLARIPWPPPIHSGVTAYNSPGFERLVEFCEHFGVNCDAPEYGEDGLFDLTSRAQADAEKRMALYSEEWAEFVEAWEEDYGHSNPVPQTKESPQTDHPKSRHTRQSLKGDEP